MLIFNEVFWIRYIVFLKTFIMLLVRDQPKPLRDFYDYPDLVMNFLTFKRSYHIIELPNSLKAGDTA